MNPFDLREALRTQPFEPLVVVTNSGDRYVIKHPEMAQLMENGTLLIFEPSERDDATAKRMTRVGYVNIAALEPLREKAA